MSYYDVIKKYGKFINKSKVYNIVIILWSIQHKTLIT